MRLVVLGGLVASLVAGAAWAQGTGDGTRRRQAIQLDGDLAELADGDSQHLVVPVLAGDTQYYVIVVYLWRDGRPLAIATPMAEGGQEVPEGSATYRAVMEAYSGLMARAQSYMAERAGAGSGAGTGDFPASGGTGGEGVFGIPGGTGGKDQSAADGGSTSTGTGGSAPPPLSRYPHEVRENSDGTVTVRVTIPSDRLMGTGRVRPNLELQTIAANTARREVSPGRWVTQARVQMELTGDNGSESNPDGSRTYWRTFRVTPQ